MRAPPLPPPPSTAPFHSPVPPPVPPPNPTTAERAVAERSACRCELYCRCLSLAHAEAAPCLASLLRIADDARAKQLQAAAQQQHQPHQPHQHQHQQQAAAQHQQQQWQLHLPSRLPPSLPPSQNDAAVARAIGALVAQEGAAPRRSAAAPASTHGGTSLAGAAALAYGGAFGGAGVAPGQVEHAARRSELEAAFHRIDANANGLLSRAEVIRACRHDEHVRTLLGLSRVIRQEDGTRDAFEKVFQRLDQDDSKAISLKEFVDLFGVAKAGSACGSAEAIANMHAWGTAHMSVSDAHRLAHRPTPKSQRTPSGEAI